MEGGRGDSVSCIKIRYVFALLSAAGMAIIYGHKVNLSVAIVAMVNHTAASSSKSHVEEGHQISNELICSNGSSSEDQEDGPFHWSEPEQGLILGSYFWGYLLTQIPGGRVAELFGGKWVYFGAVILSSLSTLLTPIGSYLGGYVALICLRILQGLAGGLTFPAMNVLISKWAPKSERSMIGSIIYGGTALGTVISIPSSGLIAGSPLGWEGIFYLHGGLPLIWCILWIICVADYPSSHPFISNEEKDYILSSQNQQSSLHENDGTSKKIPIKDIFTSIPVYAIIISHTLNNFGWYMLLVELPLFMRNGLGFNIKENAGLSALPFLFNWLFSVLYSNRLDWAINNKYISTTVGRKISMSIASIIPAICFIIIIFSGCDKVTVVTLMIIGTTFFGSMFAGVFSNHTDIASNYAGVLMGISNMAATLPGFIVPAFVGYMTHQTPGLSSWHTVFAVTSGILIVEFIAYSLMASGEEQPWNKPKRNGAV